MTNRHTGSLTEVEPEVHGKRLNFKNSNPMGTVQIRAYGYRDCTPFGRRPLVVYR